MVAVTSRGNTAPGFREPQKWLVPSYSDWIVGPDGSMDPPANRLEVRPLSS
jgi:hypothetical protein